MLEIRQNKAVQIPDCEMTVVVRFLRDVVIPKKRPDNQAVDFFVRDLNRAKDRANKEGWINEEEFFAKHEDD